MKKGIYILLFFMLGSFVAYGQSIRAYLSHEQVRVGDELLLQVEVKTNGAARQIRPLFPVLSAFRKKGTVRQLNLQGGQLVIYSQAYVPKEVGSFQIPSFRVRVDQRLLKTQELAVQVIAAPKQPAGTNMPNISLEVNLPKDTVYVGEQLPFEMLLVVPKAQEDAFRVSDYARSQLRGDLPKKTFWEEKLPKRPVQGRVLTRDGDTLVAFSLMETILFPLESGIFPFGNQYVNVEQTIKNEGATTSDILLGNASRRVDLLLKAEPFDLVVLPLPADAADVPVGKLALDVRSTALRVETGEAFYLNLKLTGEANFSTLPAPAFKLEPSFSFEKPIIDYQFNLYQKPYRGEREYTYEVAAAYPGSYELGPFTYAYFDPDQQRTRNATHPAIKITVSGEAVPDMLTNSEGSFYFRAIQQADDSDWWEIPFLPFLSVLMVVFALLGVWLGWRKMNR